ncbi:MULTISPECIES: hypothetical protein [Streptomyces]|nr:hypothetical protein [Streptomyces olivochromogenes]
MSLDDDKLEPTEEESIIAAADAEIDELSETNARPTLISEINMA